MDIRRFSLSTLLLCTFTLPGQTQELAGTWLGSLQAGATKLRIVLHLAAVEGELSRRLDSPDQGAQDIEIDTLSYVDGEFTFAIKALGASYRGELAADGQELAGVFTQRGRELPLTFARVDKVEEPNRPQMPTGSLPYKELQVAFSHRPGEGVLDSFEPEGTPGRSGRVSLAGTLTLPKGVGPFPAAILISGSGAQDRDETLMGHKPFYVLSDHLTRLGIAVLRYDDRGTASSTGNHSQATSADFADDAHAALQYLLTRDEIEPSCIGLIGHSEGGLIGPMLAAESEEVAFVVALAGPGVTGLEILRLQGRLIEEASGMSPAQLERSAKIREVRLGGLADQHAGISQRQILEDDLRSLYRSFDAEARKELGEEGDFIKRLVAPMYTVWMQYFLHYDPADALRKVACPFLAINGELDLQVDADQNLPVIRRCLEQGPNQDYTGKRMPGLNHLFQHTTTGALSEYGEIEETMSQEVLELISAWILERFGM